MATALASRALIILNTSFTPPIDPLTDSPAGQRTDDYVVHLYTIAASTALALQGPETKAEAMRERRDRGRTFETEPR